MNRPVFCLLAFIFAVSAFSQNFAGRITDRQNRAIYGGNVFIKESKQGLVCNENGEFGATLQRGIYNIEYRCLGYKPHNETVTITDTVTLRNITLEERLFELNEVTVSNEEDPAYPIIRKAIEKAPYYLNAAKSYTANVYIKANMGLNSVSRTMDRIAKFDDLKMSDFKDQMFVQESFNEIRFTAPDKYTQEVKAFSSTLPDNFDPKESFGLMTGSVYAPLYNMNISPLNPDAFSYYKYRYEGFSEENGLVINKIRFDAKFKDPVLINGYLYIVDGSWHVYHAELSRDIFGMKQDFRISYQTISENIHLPTTYTLLSNFSTLGIKGYFNYHSSIEYTDIEANTDLNAYIKTIGKTKKSLEIKKDTLYNITTDSLATKRDTVYWERIRTLPLADKEIASYLQKDSVQKRIDSLRREYHHPKFSVSDLIFGGRVGSDTARFHFRYDGLLSGIPEYNFVDGLWLGQKIYLQHRMGRHNKLLLSPYAYYTWSRKKLLYGTDIKLDYAPMRKGELDIRVASVSEDFNPDGITRFDNSISSAIFRESYNYFYQKDYVAVSNKIDIANGLDLTTGIEIAKRTGLSNHTHWGIWRNPGKIKPNPFAGDRFDASSYSIALSYAPRAYYSIREGKKRYEKISSPVFTIRYDEGFSSWQTNNSRYRKLQGEIKQNIKLNYFNRLDYKIKGGGFIGNTDKLHFTDYQHFDTSDAFSISKSPYTSFVLLDNYIASTNQYWTEAHINYESRYLLLKRISFLQGMPFTENLHLKSLYTPDYRLYTEIGYSIDLMRLLNIGIHASFRKGKYESFGVRLCYRLKDMLKEL